MATVVDQGKRITGSVKWFSNKKCFGFITPDEGMTSSDEDVFVHQSSILSDGFRTLREAWNVEFTIGIDDSGRPKAENVTAVGGGPCTGPRGGRGPPGGGQIDAQENVVEYVEGGGGTIDDGNNNTEEGGGGGVNDSSGGGNRRRRRRGKGDNMNNNNMNTGDISQNNNGVDGDGYQQQARNGRGRNGGRRNRRNDGEPKIIQPFWHEILEASVKSGLQIKDISTASGTIDVSVGNHRIKLGTGGYASMASADGFVAEGTFLCNAEGIASLTWSKLIVLTNSIWMAQDVATSNLPVSISLMADDVQRVGPDENAYTLWGDVPEPRSALEQNGFLMRRVVLTPRRRNA